MQRNLGIPRSNIRSAYCRDELGAVSEMLAHTPFDHRASAAVAQRAQEIIEHGRKLPSEIGALDAFIHEFDLANQEGVVLMCLAEALLRIPDEATQDALISEKIRSADWSAHLGHSGNIFVNASVWALVMTGRVLALGEQDDSHLSGQLGRMVTRIGEPVIRQAVKQAMRIISRQFVFGQNIEDALARMNALPHPEQLCSFDMLGEAARTAADAEVYFQRYRDAIATAGKAASSSATISIKLSALHPRFEDVQFERVMRELLPRMQQLAREAMHYQLPITIDAEEADRLDLTLSVFEALARDSALQQWQGLGLAVQAYQKRSSFVIDWLIALARETGRRFPVRLVKGAYWDTEIKRAQEQGLPDYPVYTLKASTDVSYLVCASKMLAAGDAFACQFATHNAHTIAAIEYMANATPFEFQRLHGMGETVYRAAGELAGKIPRCRIYAPVGAHEDLLPYLVRRLLENGANSNFVNRFLDAKAPASQLAADPIAALEKIPEPRHPRIALPVNLYGTARRNPAGVNLADPLSRDLLLGSIRAAAAQTYVVPTGATPAGMDSALILARAAQPAWDTQGGAVRAQILRTAAEQIATSRAELLHLLIEEGGKTIADAVAEAREAEDFCRYYAQQAEQHFGAATLLAGPVGERNEYSLHGRGIFACISPWNFPLAIFAGQIAAALAAGNAVIAKPAEQTPRIAAFTVQLFHRAGVPTGVLHLLCGSGESIGAALVADPCVDGVVFTGSTATAKSIARALANRAGPIAPLIAETGGVNAMIVDSSALAEQVVDDVMASAFGSAGQRCSALRILFVQDNVADRIIALLQGALKERRVGDPGDPATDIGPVIDAQALAALQAHVARMSIEATLIAQGEMPQNLPPGNFIAPHIFELKNPAQLSEEIFGPILHLVRFAGDDLDSVIASIRETGFALTIGLHSRLEERWARIFNEGLAGNMYVNRAMTGAVVGVQPFGGHGLSGTGPKAGGPNYLQRFAVERVRSINMTAAGGNADLFRL